MKLAVVIAVALSVYLVGTVHASEGAAVTSGGADDEDRKFSLGLSFDKDKGLGVSGGYASDDGKFAIGGKWNKNSGLSAGARFGSPSAGVTVSVGGNKAREEAAEQCAATQERWRMPDNGGMGCELDGELACRAAFYADLENREVGERAAEAVPFMERCCHVWSGPVDRRNPFGEGNCDKGSAVPQPRAWSPKPESVKLCRAAQERWRKGGEEECDDFRECSLAFSQEVQKFSEDRSELAGDLEQCCMAWRKPSSEANPFAAVRCVDLPRGGVDVSNGEPRPKVLVGDPSGSIQRAQEKVRRLKAQLMKLMRVHKKCNKKCKGKGKRCARKCCKKRIAKVEEAERTAVFRPNPSGEDIHLVHRAIVSWVRRMVSTVERVAEHDDVPPVLHAMAKVFCRKIQLRFNPTACVSGKHKCHIKFRDAIGVLKFPGGPRFPPSPYTRFIQRGGQDVEWCRFDWDEAKASEMARRLAKKRLRDALKRVALARARVEAARAAQAAKDQEDGAMIGAHDKMDLAQFVMLAPGATGPDAVALRFLLRAASLYRGVPVGAYSGEAVKVVEKLQERHHLTVDGVVNGKVWQQLVQKHTLRKWRKNNEEAVRAAQYLLKFKYGKQLKVCGIFNRETAAIVASMQRTHGLPMTGIIGPREWPLLLTDLNEVPKNMNSAQCHRKMGLVLGAEKAKSGADCLESEVFAMPCCRIRAMFNCEKRSREALSKSMLECREMERKMKLRKAKEDEDRRREELEEKAAMAAEKLQKCGPCRFVTLHIGDNRPEVAALRYLLEEWEVLPEQNEAVELFDPALDKVVKKLQADKGMIPAGVVGTQTWLRLIGPEFLWRRSRFDRAIRALQYILKRKFGAPVRITGKYDRATQRAVVEFQRKEGLKVDGMVGGHTWSALMGDKADKNRLASRRRAARMQAAGHSQFVTLQKGDEGPAVAAMKYLLKEHQLMTSNNAEFDEATEKIVNEYRSKFHVEGGATGSCGPRMWLSLISAGPQLRTGVERPDAIRAVQYLLKHKYGVALTIDGRFTGELDKAVREFQVSSAIAEDGIVGPITWQRLLPADSAPDADSSRRRHKGPYSSKFTSIQTESEIEEEITGLVEAVTQNLDPAAAAAEVCTALQSKFNSPNIREHRPGCLDGKMHCAEGFYLAIGAIKKLTDLGPHLGGCHHKYDGNGGAYTPRGPSGGDNQDDQPGPEKKGLEFGITKDENGWGASASIGGFKASIGKGGLKLGGF